MLNSQKRKKNTDLSSFLIDFTPDYKSIVITTRPPIAWYEMELNVHKIHYR